MMPSDGAFGSVVESVQAAIDTRGISPGKHIAYVVGTDADGNEGIFSAILLELVAGICINADANSGNVCSSDSDCSGAKRRLRGDIAQDSQKNSIRQII